MDALDDVRLIVHELSSDDLTLLLVQMRSQLGPRLRAQGLRLRWDDSCSFEPPKYYGA